MQIIPFFVFTKEDLLKKSFSRSNKTIGDIISFNDKRNPEDKHKIRKIILWFVIIVIASHLIFIDYILYSVEKRELKLSNIVLSLFIMAFVKILSLLKRIIDYYFR